MHYSRWIKGAPLALAATTTLAATVPQDLTELTGSEAAAMVCARTVSSRQLVEAFLARIDSHRQLNAFIAVDATHALAQADAYDQRLARGEACLPLGGVPIGIKDNIQVKGFANTAGTPALKGFHPASSAPVVERLQAAGAIVVGKTSMHELAFGSSGYNTAFHVPGTIGVRNAYDPSRIAGGSSSGSGSAVGARLVPLALGTDTGGSVRQPCALNGCVGLRPTVGRYSQHGITPISPTRDTAGPMARSVEDVILLDRIITGEQSVAAPAPAQIRLGVVSEFWTDLAPEVEQQARAALAQLEKAGVTLVPVTMPGIHELNARISMPIALYEGRDALQAWLRDQHTGVSLEALARQISGPDVKGLFEHFIMPRKLPHPDGQVTDLTPAYRWAMDTGRPQLIQHYRTLLDSQNLDALVFPTTPELAIPSNPQATSFDAFARMIRNTDPGSNAGLPGISLPIGLAGTPALPVGLELDGLPGSDARLLAIAQTLQNLIGRQPLSRH